MSKPRIPALAALLLTPLLLIFFHYFVKRPDLSHGPLGMGHSCCEGGKDMWDPLLIYGLMFLLFFWQLHRLRNEQNLRPAFVIAMVARLVIIFALPNYSDDFYRFLWDGDLSIHGVHPFDYRPYEVPDSRFYSSGFVYGYLNSTDYYTVYPPVLQGVFASVVAIAGNDVYAGTVLLKLWIVLAELLSLFFLAKLTRKFSLPAWTPMIYALNPLVITELTGNLHFEAFMICFVLGALWFLSNEKWLYGAVFFTLAIGSKLLPVLFMPFLIRRLGWKRFFLFSSVTGVLTLALFAPYIFPLSRLSHLLESLRLYFSYFEFNGGVYRIGKYFAGWENRELLRYILMGTVAAVILFAAWRERSRDWKGLPAMMLLALAAYQLCATTIHPWYIAPLVALSALSVYRFPVLWSVFMLGTYFIYYLVSYEQPVWSLWVEYSILFLYILYEYLLRRRGFTLEEFIRATPWFRAAFRRSIPARVRIKQARIARHLRTEDTILDIGTGNGGLCHALQQQGFTITPSDVKDISFFPEVKPILCDGSHLPFENDQFSCALLITMLHHTPDPDSVLREAIRVASRLIIMEDIYRNPIQKYLTWFTDSLVNLEFSGHPHTNRSDREWKETFTRLGLKVTFREDFRTLLFYRQVVYVVERT